MWSALFFDLNAGTAFLTLYLQWRNYRRKRVGKRMPMTCAKDSIDFVMHFCISLWWILGCVLLPGLEISPFWLIGWLLVGMGALKIVMKLVDISGLSIYIAAGEVTARDLADSLLAND